MSESDGQQRGRTEGVNKVRCEVLCVCAAVVIQTIEAGGADPRLAGLAIAEPDHVLAGQIFVHPYVELVLVFTIAQRVESVKEAGDDRPRFGVHGLSVFDHVRVNQAARDDVACERIARKQSCAGGVRASGEGIENRSGQITEIS